MRLTCALVLIAHVSVGRMSIEASNGGEIPGQAQGNSAKLEALQAMLGKTGNLSALLGALSKMRNVTSANGTDRPPQNQGNPSGTNQTVNMTSELNKQVATIKSYMASMVSTFDNRSFEAGSRINCSRDLRSSYFNETTSKNDNIQECAFPLFLTKVVKSYSNSTNSKNVRNAVIYYDNTNKTAMMVIVIDGSPCIVASTNRTFEQNLQDAKTWNGTTISIKETETLKAVGPYANPQTVKAMYESNPLLKYVCPGNILIARAMGNVKPAGATTDLTVVTYGKMLTLTLSNQDVQPPKKA